MKSSVYLGAVKQVLFDPAANGKHLMVAFKLGKKIKINEDETDMAVVVLDMAQIKEMAQSLVELDKLTRKLIIV